MFEKLTTLAVRRWPLVLTATLIFCIFGWYRFQALPIEAFPDVTDPMVEIVGLYPGQAAEEVERRVTLELERVLSGTPHLVDLRSVSVFGLALVTLTFDERTSDFELRTLVAERLRDAELPEGAESIMGPQATPVGQIYRYTLRGPRSLRDLRALQDFVVERRLRAVPGVAEVVTFGGFERQYQVRIDQSRMVAAGVSIEELYEAVKRTNENAGGGYVGVGSQELIVRGLGALKNPRDLGWAVIKANDGVPIRVRDVADVVEGSTPRRGSVGRGHNDEVVEGIVLLRRGENPSVVLQALHARIELLNQEILPKDVRIATFYDRTSLVSATLSTVGKNLLEGALLVLAVVYLFLRTLRAVLIVALVLPVSMLTAFVGLHALGLPANLISLGAIDFGILVDGAIIVVEATLHALERPDTGDRSELVRRAASAVAKPVGFAMSIIIVALGPIFALERVEGRIFAPMAYTYAFALLGALGCAMLVVPALETILMRGSFRAAEPRWLTTLGNAYGRVLERLRRARGLVLTAFAAGVVALALVGAGIGTEFLPELNEGGFYITSVFPSTISLDETRKSVRELRARLLKTPEVRDVLSHVGRPEDATQAEGPNNAELFVVLAPENEWRRGKSRHDLEREMRSRLQELPGVQYNFSQPITDRVFETISGIIGQVVVKVRGENLTEMTGLAEQVRVRLAKVPGVTDLALYQAGSIPSLAIEIDRDALARRGLAVEDVQRTVRLAMGGEVATEIWQGERRFAVTLRLPDSVRANPDTLGRLVVGDPSTRTTLGELARIFVNEGRSSIWREDFTRFVALKFNVRGRDLGSTVDDARGAVGDLEVPEGMYLTWGGEFQNQKRAMKRLAITLPLSLAAIIGILFMNHHRVLAGGDRRCGGRARAARREFFGQQRGRLHRPARPGGALGRDPVFADGRSSRERSRQRLRRRREGCLPPRSADHGPGAARTDPSGDVTRDGQRNAASVRDRHRCGPVPRHARPLVHPSALVWRQTTKCLSACGALRDPRAAGAATPLRRRCCEGAGRTPVASHLGRGRRTRSHLLDRGRSVTGRR
jgi:cobalt-zinc-cadmium resistance protein CzcA